MPGTKIKICGLRRNEDIEYANILLPGYAGFILADGFKRQITRGQAEKFAEKLDSSIIRTGVFVNQPVNVVADYINSGIIQCVQLHGDEDNAYINNLMECTKNRCNIIKAVRVRCAEDIEKAAAYNCDYLLFDAYSGKQAGGNGITFDWTLTRNVKKPFFLAGGISAGNVEDAIKTAAPYAVDAISSMETGGYKDFNKMKEFVDTVNRLNNISKEY